MSYKALLRPRAKYRWSDQTLSRQADQRDTTNRSRIKDHQHICHPLATDTQMSRAAATMTAAAVRQADHYTASAGERK